MRHRTIGIDTGGTFTDLIVSEPDGLRVAKVPSTPADPVQGVLDGLALLGDLAPDDPVVHGTTVALNALLTGRTAVVALVTGEGFRDLVEIGRQNRPDIYSLHPERPAPLVPRKLRFEIPQRIWPSLDDRGRAAGFERVREPSTAELGALRSRLKACRAESIAICLLHSWADPTIEQRVADALTDLDRPLTLSAGILPEHREFERFSTAIVNAALVPLMQSYLGSLEERSGMRRLSILQSNGGSLAARRAAREPVRVVLSGPAGGVIGAAQAARETGFQSFVAFDMGGTSTDVAFHGVVERPDEREASRATEPVRIAGHPIGVPTLDIHTIGCGGGSLVTVDAGGVLHVGPESAGADPGPVCYGKSDAPTVTDAHVLLGHISEGPFLSGGLPLRHDEVERAFDCLGRRLGVSGVEAARGVLDVARAAMRRAVGVMTMQRGQDPKKLPLIAFGGAGGLHGAALAQSLGMRAAVVPLHPGALSARGMTNADPILDQTQTVLEPLSSWTRPQLRKRLRELGEEGKRQLVEAGHPKSSVRFENALDLRYAGQSFEIRVPLIGDPAEAFKRAHERLYGYRLDEREVELVCLRSRALVPHRAPEPQRVRKRRLPERAVLDRRRAFFDRFRKVAVLDRAELGPGHAFRGPALVEEYSGTTVVPQGWQARVSAGGHLVLEAG